MISEMSPLFEPFLSKCYYSTHLDSGNKEQDI